MTLREEQVEVERRPADRKLKPEEAEAAFEEKTVEMLGTSEEASVRKEARVVGEVALGKRVEERKETVKDTVRRSEVEVEEIKPAARPRGAERRPSSPASGQPAASAEPGARAPGSSSLSRRRTMATRSPRPRNDRPSPRPRTLGKAGRRSSPGPRRSPPPPCGNNARARRVEREHPPRGRFLEVDGVRLHYLERGGAGRRWSCCTATSSPPRTGS